ncbi:MAG: hypothetical protein LBM70_06055 [Victivallales bacterium]|jgi:hypothetical protein|nr:hypothetical protein [Victivallales bacterium]
MISKDELKPLEQELNSPDRAIRKNAQSELAALFRNRQIPTESASILHNMHCHTIYSYNGYGFTPSFIAYLARKSGHLSAGIIDFDVLDAVDEFKSCAEQFDINYSCGIETRVFVKELADVAINSPGEPGIAYHLGLGFSNGELPPCAKQFACSLRNTAAERIQTMIKLVNGTLDPIRLDFQADVVPLTPAGNATERHLCQAYRTKAENIFPDRKTRAEFWSKKLNTSVTDADKLISDPVKLEAKIRSCTMKKGGVGYIAPTALSFPALEDFNAFVVACGAIPTIAWLDGLSKGEADVDRLLDLHIAKGGAMLGIVPDRNITDARRIAELDRVVAACVDRDMPIIIGTEMNAPGLKLVDDINAEPLKKHAETFANGARILAGHTLFSKLGRGYLSDWAKRELPEKNRRNAFYAQLGKRFSPSRFESVRNWPEEVEKIKILIDSVN